MKLTYLKKSFVMQPWITYRQRYSYVEMSLNWMLFSCFHFCYICICSWKLSQYTNLEVKITSNSFKMIRRNMKFILKMSIFLFASSIIIYCLVTDLVLVIKPTLTKLWTNKHTELKRMEMLSRKICAHQAKTQGLSHISYLCLINIYRKIWIRASRSISTGKCISLNGYIQILA